MDPNSPAEELPTLYRAILDRVALLEAAGERGEAGRVRLQATTRLLARLGRPRAPRARGPPPPRRTTDRSPNASLGRGEPRARGRANARQLDRATSDRRPLTPAERARRAGRRLPPCHPPPSPTRSTAPSSAYDELTELGEEIEDEWTYVNDLASAWRERLEDVGGRPRRRRARGRRDRRRHRPRDRRDRADHRPASRDRLAVDVPAGRAPRPRGDAREVPGRAPDGRAVVYAGHPGRPARRACRRRSSPTRPRPSACWPAP